MTVATSSRELMAWICELEDHNPFPLADVDDLIAHAREEGLVSDRAEDEVRRRLVDLVDRHFLGATDPLAAKDTPIPAEQRSRTMSELHTTAEGRAWAAGAGASDALGRQGERTGPAAEADRARDPRKVAVMHGRDADARRAVVDFLRRVDLDPLEWDDLVDLTKDAAPYNGEAVAAAFDVAQAVVVVLTPDDVGYLHPSLRREREVEDDREPTGQARLNVVLEAGMALQSHPRRTVLVEIGRVRAISDLAGRSAVRLSGQPDQLNRFAQRLERTGCPVRRTGADWLDATSFAALSALTRQATPVSQPLPATSDDELTLEIAAAAARADVGLTERQVTFLAEYLRTTTEPFDSFALQPLLPAPTLPGGSINRLLTDLHLQSGIIDPAPGDDRGYVSTKARGS